MLWVICDEVLIVVVLLYSWTGKSCHRLHVFLDKKTVLHIVPYDIFPHILTSTASFTVITQYKRTNIDLYRYDMAVFVLLNCEMVIVVCT